MTDVTSTRSDARRAPRLAEVAALLSVVLGVATLLAAVIAADGDARRHSLWRDPISWFASDEAPDPERVRALLVAVGVALVALALAGAWGRRPRVAVAPVGLAGALVVGLGVWSIECSVRFAYCEGRVAAGFVGGEHLAHVVLSAGLVVLVTAVVVVGAARHPSRVSTAAAAVAIVAAGAILVRPTNGWVGTLQLVLFGLGAVSSARLWRANA